MSGTVRARPEGMVNPARGRGEIELAATAIDCAEARARDAALPDRGTTTGAANELLRLTYRYLDLRRPEMTRRKRLRHDVSRITREYLNERGFVEIETPILTARRRRARATSSCPRAWRPGSSTRCRNRRSSSSSC